MSIVNAGDWPLDGNETGADLWPILNRLSAAIFSDFAYATRPPEIVDGGLWTRDESGGNHSLMLFSGGKDVALMRSTTAGEAASTYFYTKTQVDNLVADLAAQVAAVGSVPIGGIIMWSGSIASIPSGFRLCNGAGGTPNLRDRFIVAAGGAYGVGDVGGTDTITTVPRHSHAFSGQTDLAGSHDHGGQTGADGAHSHAIEESAGGDRTNDPASGPGYTGADDRIRSSSARISTAGNHRHTIPVVGNHRHDFSGQTDNTGASGGVDIRPRYYALAYIQRIS